ncbi:MAG: MarR family transcriptional regulator [Actinomycetota bacterium]
MKPDHVDEILDQWQRERPDIDVSAMAILGRIARLDKTIRPRLDAVFAEHDLESWEFDVLATLRRAGAPHQLTPGELLRSMMVTSGAMTNRIRRLEQRGLVARVAHPDDGRQVLVTLTQDGLQTVDAAVVAHADNQRRIVDVLDPAQRRHLADLLRAFDLGLADHPQS